MPALFAVACVILLLAPVAWFIRKLARRVVGVEPRRKTITARRADDTIVLPVSTATMAAGQYGLWFGPSFEHHALVGEVVRSSHGSVARGLVTSTAPVPSEPFEAQWTGHIMSSPAEIDGNWEDVDVPLSDGASAPAWLFRSRTSGRPWVIHVQGIRTSRLVTLRSVEVAQRAGFTSLVITYRGSGDGPSTDLSSLGQREWSDLADAVAYARSNGAPAVYVVAWSMGAGLALELLRQDPSAFDRLALIAPATNWRQIIRRGVKNAGLPGFFAPVVTWALGSPLASRFIGMLAPLDFDRLDWSRATQVTVPTLVVHSKGDEEIPFELTTGFAAVHPEVTLVQTSTAPHGWEANVAPDQFESALRSWLEA